MDQPVRRIMPRPLIAGARAVLAVAIGLAAACVPQYMPPSMSEPHAVVKVRLAYHACLGPQLAQAVNVNETRVAGFPAPIIGGDGLVNRAVLVRPRPTTWTIESNFFHTITTMAGRNVMTTTIRDGGCQAALTHAPQPDGVYLLQYDFFADGHCTLRCFRQSTLPDGTVVNGPCEPAPAPAP